MPRSAMGFERQGSGMGRAQGPAAVFDLGQGGQTACTAGHWLGARLRAEHVEVRRSAR